MKRKIIGYIGAIIIGIGFLIMAAEDALHSEIASVMQVVLGVVFISTSI